MSQSKQDAVAGWNGANKMPSLSCWWLCHIST